MKCNHCGKCCKSQICLFGLDVWPELSDYEYSNKCPAIKHVDGKILCDLIQNPSMYFKDSEVDRKIKFIKTKLRIGVGCTNSYCERFDAGF